MAFLKNKRMILANALLQQMPQQKVPGQEQALQPSNLGKPGLEPNMAKFRLLKQENARIKGLK